MVSAEAADVLGLKLKCGWATLRVLVVGSIDTVERADIVDVDNTTRESGSRSEVMGRQVSMVSRVKNVM